MWYIWLLLPIGLFAFAGLVGAPYLPVRKNHVDEVLGMLNLQEGQTLLELGCGDGSLMIAAAKRGIGSVGFEVNPIMFAVAWARCFRYRRLVKVRLGNMWKAQWPEADAVYTFLIPRLMSKLDLAMQAYATKPIRLVSYVFEIPDKVPVATSKNSYGYEYQPSVERN